MSVLKVDVPSPTTALPTSSISADVSLTSPSVSAPEAEASSPRTTLSTPSAPEPILSGFSTSRQQESAIPDFEAVNDHLRIIDYALYQLHTAPESRKVRHQVALIEDCVERLKFALEQDVEERPARKMSGMEVMESIVTDVPLTTVTMEASGIAASSATAPVLA